MGQPITTPIALNCTNNATLTMPWFVQRTEYNPAQATFQPLVNGEEAFGAVQDAIAAAKRSIDIICWGFQPSMYFKRGGGELVSIGELLARMGASGVKVRLLCWQDDLFMAELSENNMPGGDLVTSIKQHLPDFAYSHMSMLSRDYQDAQQLDADVKWYERASLGSPQSQLQLPDDLKKRYSFENVELATRDFSFWQRLEIAYRTWLGKDASRGFRNKLQNSTSMALEPTHHQKMVLVDYELPEQAVGFVMGHNMLDQYWDRDDHSYQRMKPIAGRCGPYPWQDISSRVTGPVLDYLNRNFCEAWDKATGQNLTAARANLKSRLTLCHDSGVPVMAQIVRTQSQDGKRDIEKMYLQAVNNVSNFIFIENQYFRWVPLADKIKEAVNAQLKKGRDSAKPVYLFVITNSSDEAVGNGTVNTYRMLDALGQAKSIPGVASLEQEDARQSSLSQQYTDATDQASQANQTMLAAGEASMFGNTPAIQQQLESAKQSFSQATAEQKKVMAEMKEAPKPVLNRDLPGLKVQVCTLVAPDSPPGHWLPVYVHAKLMVVDDIFMTVGSANVNTRSMEADSELNIFHENAAVTAPLRRRLWNLHTNGIGAQDDMKEASTNWAKIAQNNADLQADGKQSPYASLVQFMRTSNSRSYSD
jgi:phosphatidylserine/phosphatidylglycerophosphate/cardiolipin synthase-like enzyme